MQKVEDGHCRPGASRTAQQRRQRAALGKQLSDSAERGVDWLTSGTRCDAAAPELKSELRQRLDVLTTQRLRDSCPVFSEEEAARMLLQSRVGYDSLDSADSCLAAFEPGNVSLPETNSGSPLASSLLEGESRENLERFDVHMLRSSAELDELNACSQAPKLHMDPVLASNPHTYASFVRDLACRGILSYTSTPLEYVTVFFVRKKSGKLRLVVDCRNTNRRFRPAPKVRLASPDSFASLEVPEEFENDDFYVSKVDVADAFHRLRISPQFSDYFCLQGVFAGAVGVSEVRGAALQGFFILLSPDSPAGHFTAALPVIFCSWTYLATTREVLCTWGTLFWDP